MPIYLYNCGSCHQTREYFLNSGQEPHRCEECDEVGKFTRVYDGQTISMQMDAERNGSSPHNNQPKGFIPLVGIPVKIGPGEKDIAALVIGLSKKD